MSSYTTPGTELNTVGILFHFSLDELFFVLQNTPPSSFHWLYQGIS